MVSLIDRCGAGAAGAGDGAATTGAGDGGAGGAGAGEGAAAGTGECAAGAGEGGAPLTWMITPTAMPPSTRATAIPKRAIARGDSLVGGAVGGIVADAIGGGVVG